MKHVDGNRLFSPSGNDYRRRENIYLDENYLHVLEIFLLRNHDEE